MRKAAIASASRCVHACLLRMVSNACEMPRLADGHGFAVKNASASSAASAVLKPLIGTVAMRVVNMPKTQQGKKVLYLLLALCVPL